MKSDVTKRLVLVEQQIAEARLAEPHRILQYRFKNRLQFAGRRTDDLQHFRGRDLLLLQFAHLAVACGELFLECPIDGGGAVSGLPTTLCRGRLFQPRRGAYAAVASFHCRPWQKPTEMHAYCSML